MTHKIPRIGILLGDSSGIGPELVAKLLSTPEVSPHASVIVIGDPRITKKSYGKIFLNSLPMMPVTSELQDVQLFFKETLEEEAVA